jgi:hypothetical protein
MPLTSQEKAEVKKLLDARKAMIKRHSEEQYKLDLQHDAELKKLDAQLKKYQSKMGVRKPPSSSSSYAGGYGEGCRRAGRCG